MNNKPTIEELSVAMEKMYKEHNAQMRVLSKMITTLARISVLNPEKFLEEVNSEENLEFANNYNVLLDKQIKELSEDN